MKPRLIRVAGLKFYLNPVRKTRFPFLRYHFIRKNKASYHKKDLARLQKFLKKQLERFPVDRRIPLRLTRLAKREAIVNGFLGRTFRELSCQERAFYPIFSGLHPIFLDCHSLQAESFIWGEASREHPDQLGTYISCLSAGNEGLFLHAATIVKDGFAYLFLGRSGAGKSTTAKLSKKYRVLHDDFVLMRRLRGRFFVYSLPEMIGGVSGYSYSRKGFPVKAVFLLKKAKRISFKPLSKTISLSSMLLYHILYFRFLPDYLARQAFATAFKLFKNTPCFEMRFTRDKDFWPELEKSLGGK